MGERLSHYSNQITRATANVYYNSLRLIFPYFADNHASQEFELGPLADPVIRLPDINADQHLGGAIAWGASEVPLVMVVFALVTQWARQDRRAAVRSDRHADAGLDDDLAAYNNMLRELARQRTSE